MMKSPDCVKRYSSAKSRFLKGALINFFQKEFPKLFGPVLREKIVEELIKIIETNSPSKDHLKPGQMLWNAVDISTRADSKNPKFIPVILTIINQEDIEKLSNGQTVSKIRNHAIDRILVEAYKQGALLSMRDIGLFSWRYSGTISKYRKQYEKEHNVTLPHTGSIQDMGSCISHKKIIIQKIIVEKKDPLVVSKETKHSMQAVDRYLKDFHRVQHCYRNGKDIHFTTTATGLNKFVVKQYWEILQNTQKNA